MPDFCVAIGCSNERNKKTKEQGITFHRFPKEESKRWAWTAAVRRRDFVPNDRSVVCSRHFRSDDFDRTGQTTRLKEGVVPTVFSFNKRPARVSVGQEPATIPPRTRTTSQQAAEPARSRSRSRSRSPVQTHGGLNISKQSTIDHQYTFDPVKAKKQLIEAQQKMEELKRSIRNAKDRERRHQKTMKSLVEDLKNERMLTEELLEQLS